MKTTAGSRDPVFFKERASVGPALAAIGALFLLGFLVYSNTFGVPFEFDDAPSIIDNAAIRHIHNVGDIWNFWPTRFLTYLSFAFDYHFHRLDVLGYHIFNLAVHVGSAVLVWWFGLLTFSTPVMRGRKIARHARLISLFAGLIFVAHPVQTQAVTYIVQRAVSLAAFFYLASLCLYARSRLSGHADTSEGRGPERFYYAGSLSMAVLAMFTKEISITLPFAVCLYEFSFFKTKTKLEWGRLLPFLLCVFIIPLTMLKTGSVNIQEIRLAAEEGPGISSGTYLLTQLRVMVTYIRLLFLPLNQNLDYDYPIANTLLELPVLASLFFLAGILFLAVKLFKNHRLISFGIFYFFLVLLPESSILPIRDVIVEHRLYLSMAGFSLFLAGSAATLLGNKNTKAMALIIALTIIPCSVLTYARNSVWTDALALRNDIIRKSPHKARPYLNRGRYYQDTGDPDRALLDFDKAIEISPGYPAAYNNRANIYLDRGEYARALADYNLAIEIKPDYAVAYNNRGNLYQYKGDFRRALADYNSAIELKPDYDKAYGNRGCLYRRRGDLDRALLDFDKAIEIEPGFAMVYCNRGYAHFGKGSFDQALRDLNRAIEIDPNYAEAYYKRALVYFNKREYAESRKDVIKARALQYKVDPLFLEQLKAASGRGG